MPSGTELTSTPLCLQFLLSGSLASGDIVTSVSDLKIGVDRSSADMRLAHGAGGKATVVKADVMARNGVLHVIDVVMSPATMSLRQLIEGMPRFSFFSSLSQGIRLDAAPGSGDALLTVFAPRNAAFDTILADSRKLSALDLGKVAMQHVSVGTYLTGTLWDGIAIPVLDGNFIRFWIEEQPDAPGSVLHADDIRVPDIMATNGAGATGRIPMQPEECGANYRHGLTCAMCSLYPCRRAP